MHFDQPKQIPNANMNCDRLLKTNTKCMIVTDPNKYQMLPDRPIWVDPPVYPTYGSHARPPGPNNDMWSYFTRWPICEQVPRLVYTGIGHQQALDAHDECPFGCIPSFIMCIYMWQINAYIWGVLTSNPGLSKFQGSKTSSQSRRMYNKVKKKTVFHIYGPEWEQIEITIGQVASRIEHFSK